MTKVLDYLKKYWFLLFIIPLFFIFWDKIKGFFSFNAREDSEDNSGSDYLGGQVSQDDKGVIVSSDGEEYFRYGPKKVRLTTANKSRVVEFVTAVYDYGSVNTDSLSAWLLNDNLHFYTGEIQALLQRYNAWCDNRETWIHYFAYVFKELHSVNFLDYLRACLSAEGYEATSKYVPNLNLYFY